MRKSEQNIVFRFISGRMPAQYIINAHIRVQIIIVYAILYYCYYYLSLLSHVFCAYAYAVQRLSVLRRHIVASNKRPSSRPIGAGGGGGGGGGARGWRNVKCEVSTYTRCVRRHLHASSGSSSPKPGGGN